MVDKNADIQRMLDEAVAILKTTTVGYSGHTTAWQNNKTTKWWKSLDLIAQARAALDPSTPLAQFGALLPARLPESTGSVYEVTSMAALNARLGDVPDGSIIRIMNSIDGGGTGLVVARNASPTAPITITSDPSAVLHNWDQLYVTGSYLRFRKLNITKFVNAGIKPTATAHYVEIDGCHIYGDQSAAGSTPRQGILVTGNAHHIQIWNNVIHHCGNDRNQDHGIYFAWTGGPGCVIANNLLYDNWAYNLQVYPQASNLIVTCNTCDGGMIQPDNRGGVVIGSEGQGMHDVDVVGLLTTNAPAWGFNCYDPYDVDRNMRAYDSLAYGNHDGNWDTGPAWTMVNCTVADPLYVNRAAKDFRLQRGSPAIGKIQPSRHGYVPPKDILGRPRVTADAGCYAATT